MRISITGTPGTGKSSVAKIVANLLDCRLIDIKKIEKAGEVDVAKLRKKIMKIIRNCVENQGFVLEGHLACEFFVPCDYVFVLRTKPKTLAARLKKRGYGEKKLSENLVAEMLDYCSQKVERNYGKRKKRTARIIEIETSGKTAKETANRLIAAIKNRNKNVKGDSVDYKNDLIRYAKKGR